MAQGVKISKEIREKIVNEFKRGRSIPELYRSYKLGESTIYTILKSAGVDPKYYTKMKREIRKKWKESFLEDDNYCENIEGVDKEHNGHAKEVSYSKINKVGNAIFDADLSKRAREELTRELKYLCEEFAQRKKEQDRLKESIKEIKKIEMIRTGISAVALWILVILLYVRS